MTADIHMPVGVDPTSPIKLIKLHLYVLLLDDDVIFLEEFEDYVNETNSKGGVSIHLVKFSDISKCKTEVLGNVEKYSNYFHFIFVDWVLDPNNPSIPPETPYSGLSFLEDLQSKGFVGYRVLYTANDVAPLELLDGRAQDNYGLAGFVPGRDKLLSRFATLIGSAQEKREKTDSKLIEDKTAILGFSDEEWSLADAGLEKLEWDRENLLQFWGKLISLDPELFHYRTSRDLCFRGLRKPFEAKENGALLYPRIYSSVSTTLMSDLIRIFGNVGDEYLNERGEFSIAGKYFYNMAAILHGSAISKEVQTINEKLNPIPWVSQNPLQYEGAGVGGMESVLRDAYSESEGLVQISKRAGVDSREIDFNGAVGAIPMRVMDQACREGKLPNLAREFLDDKSVVGYHNRLRVLLQIDESSIVLDELPSKLA